MRLVIKTIFSILAISAIVILAYIGFMYYMFHDMVGNDVVKTELSPNGKLKAVAFIRNGGATTDFSPQVSILKTDNEFRNRSGNVFRGYHSNFIDIKWEDETTLIIYYHCSEKDISKKETELNGIKIKYNN